VGIVVDERGAAACAADETLRGGGGRIGWERSLVSQAGGSTDRSDAYNQTPTPNTHTKLKKTLIPELVAGIPGGARVLPRLVLRGQGARRPRRDGGDELFGVCLVWCG
jgi:hypothetical protein